MTSGHSRPARFRSSKSGKRTNALRISELEQALLNASTSNVALLNAKGEILAVNEAWLQYGRNNSKTPGKLPAKISVGTNYLEVLKNTSGVDEADAAAAMAAILSVLKGRKRSVSIEYPCSVPGQTDWFKMTVTILKGKTRRVLVAHENISAQKLLETSRIEMQQLVETNPSGFATYREHPDGRISMPFVSKRWEELVELRAEDVATDATPFISRAHPDDLPMLVEQLEKARKNHSVIKVEYRLRTPSRGTRWVEVYAAPRRDPDGSTVFMGSLTDITDHKLAESALLDNRALEHQMSRFVQIAPGAYYSFSHQSNGRAQLRFASPRFEELAGPLLEQLKVDFWQCFQLAHPEDINNIKKSVLEAFQRQVPWHQEFRIVQANGEVVWMEGWAEPSQQQQDEILWYGIMMEITHRKKAEEARKKIEDELIQSEYNYRILAENIGSPVATCDENGVFLYVNNTFASLNGMTPEQMIGGVYFPNIPEERVHTRILKIREVLASGQPYSDEIVDNVNGERKWHLRTMRPMRIKGNFKQVLITGHDITEHKKEQELLSRYAQDLEQQVRLRTQELE
ncbi:MAG: PAS domain S-box protein, partial [Cyclobacteriaceae bacterium]|nr:PAS domain S-box protein [Cyclobacteriaceae bacterium]